MAKINESITNEALERAKTDAEYRARLLTDPHGALNEVAGEPIDAELKIQAVGRDADSDIVLVVPPLRDELTAEELEAVAGGDVNGQCGPNANVYKCGGTLL